MDHRHHQHHHWKYVICFLLICLSVSDMREFSSNRELRKLKAKCKKERLETKMQTELQKSGKSKEDDQKMQPNSSLSDECKEVDNFKVTENEVKSWLNKSKNDVNEVYEILKGADKETLKEFVKNEKDKWLKDPDSKAVVTALGEEITKKSGGSKGITLADLEDFGSTAVYMVRPGDYKGLSDEVFKYILGIISEETEKAQLSQVEVDFGAVSTKILQNPDKARIKALCRRAFRLYKRSKDLNTEEGWKNIKYLLFCAPPNVCKSVRSDWIQNDIESVVFQPWTCRTTLKRVKDGNEKENIDEENMLQQEKETKRLFPSNRPCGKILAGKLVNEGKTPYEINELDAIAKLQDFSACLQDKVLKEAVESIGCDFAAMATKRGILNRKLTSYAAKKCAKTPDNIENVTCASLDTTYKPYLQSMKRSFFKNLPKQVMCDATCVELFKENLPEDMMKYIMKKCYKDTVLSSSQIKEMGDMLLDLPIEKFEEISAEDLESGLKKIKEDLKASSKEGGRKKKRGRKVAFRKLAKKLIDDGNVAALIDSSDIMNEVSLRDLKASLAESDDVIRDLGINNLNGSLGMTDSQKKWVMKKVLKKRKPESFTVEDIREMKSLVTGLLSSHIKKMGEAHSNDSAGMELATEMCSYSDWPRKSLEAISKDLIQSSLEVRNSTDPMSTLTVVDVQGLGCHCLLNFDASKYEDMDKDVCSAMCMKIGYCDTFKCLNPTRRKNVLQACLKCKDLGTVVITDTDFDELGPNLISQMSKTQLDLVPAQVLNSGIQLFKDMCMDKTLRTAVSGALQEVIGRSGGQYSSDTLYQLGSAIKLLPRSLQQQLDKTVLSEMQAALIEELAPNSEEDIKLKKCCEKWLDETDLESLKEQNFNLMMTVKEAIFSQSDTASRRRKRASNIFTWTCRQIRPLPLLFSTASSEEIDAMDEKEFLDCLQIIGSVTGFKEWQRTLLLEKVKKAVGKSNVCKMDVSYLANLGVISLALSRREISCLPVNETSLVSSLGSVAGWSPEQLRILAMIYVSANNLTTLFWMTDSNITMLGSILCGFTPEWIATLSSVEVGKSGKDIGSLRECGVDRKRAFVKLAVYGNVYGPVHTWDAADLNELKHIVAGLSGTEIQQLSLDAIEGLDDEVIPEIPEDVLKEMSTAQLKAFTDIQARSVTDAQKEVMTIEQRVILGDVPTEAAIGYGYANSGTGLEKTFWSLLTMVVMAVLAL